MTDREFAEYWESELRDMIDHLPSFIANISPDHKSMSLGEWIVLWRDWEELGTKESISLCWEG